jgi:hypothetical protein
MTTAVPKGTLRFGEVGPEFSGEPGSVVAFGADGRTLAGIPAANAAALSALELFSAELVAPAGSTTGADGPVHTAASLLGTGVTAFPAGSSLALELLSLVSGDGAGIVEAGLTLEVSVDGGTVWAPLPDPLVSWFTADALNVPVDTAVMFTTFDLSGLPSFALRPVYTNDAGAAATASFASPRVRWSYLAP